MIRYADFYGPYDYRPLEDLLRSVPPIPEHLSHWNPNAKEYAVKYSAHGCAAVWEGAGPPPKQQWVILQEARRRAFHWSGIADTVSGNAEIIHMPTNQDIGRWY